MLSTNLSPQLLTRQVVLVNEKDQVVGSASLLEAHRGKGLLHRASSVFLFRQKNHQLEFLLQQRSSEKILAGNLWASTVCGNVSPGENYKQCIIRRLKEELNIENITLTELVKYRYQVNCDNGFTENEIDQIFVGWFDDSVTPNPAEVSRVSWVNWQLFLAFIQKQSTEPINLNLNGKQISQFTDFAPWVNLMFNEPKVLKPLKKFLNKV